MQRYQRDREFKYREHMLFLRDDQLISTTKLQAADTLISDWPEFIITEKDVTDVEPPEEYVFLEVDDHLNSQQKTTDFGTRENRCRKNSEMLGAVNKLTNQKLNLSNVKTHNDVNSEIMMQVKHRSNNVKDNYLMMEDSRTPNTVAVPFNQQEEEKTSMTPLIRLQVYKDVKAVAESGKEVTIKATKNGSCSSSFEISSEKQAALDQMNDIKQLPSPTKLQDANKIDGQSERSEDVIFGELIVAMLKRMDEDKKRVVKKEIMNLLLT